MTSVQFQAVHTRKQVESPREDLFLLEPSAWDDYDVRCSFLLIPSTTPDRPIGTWKIIDSERPRAPRTELPPRFMQLPSHYLALGQHVNAYQGLATLPPANARAILEGLRDMILRPRPEVENKLWFKRTLGRFASARSALERADSVLAAGGIRPRPGRFKAKGHALRADLQPSSSSFDLLVSAHLQGFSSKHVLRLSFARTEGDAGIRRMVVLVGPNGAGKTQLLAALARSLSGLESKAVEIEPDKPFTQVIAVSYSAFDHFTVPRLPGAPISYVYCGLRVPPDHHARRMLLDLDDALEEVAMSMAMQDADTTRDAWRRALHKLELNALLDADKRGSQAMRPQLIDEHRITLDIDDAIDRTVERMITLATGPNREVWRRALRMVDLESLPDVAAGGPTAMRQHLLNELSAGQKLVVLAISNLAALLQPGSIVLHDEPETHLHPNLLSALLRAMHILLEHFDSYAIIATHSPIPAQETPSSNVVILDRYEDGGVRAFHPPEQSFASTLDEISRMVFRAGPQDQNFQTLLAALQKHHSIAEIRELLGGELSIGARLLLATEET